MSDLQNRLDNNDNRGTARPYLLLLQQRVKVYVDEQFAYDGIEYVEQISGDFQNFESRKEAERKLADKKTALQNAIDFVTNEQSKKLSEVSFKEVTQAEYNRIKAEKAF